MMNRKLNNFHLFLKSKFDQSSPLLSWNSCLISFYSRNKKNNLAVAVAIKANNQNRDNRNWTFNLENSDSIWEFGRFQFFFRSLFFTISNTVLYNKHDTNINKRINEQTNKQTKGIPIKIDSSPNWLCLSLNDRNKDLYYKCWYVNVIRLMLWTAVIQ